MKGRISWPFVGIGTALVVACLLAMILAPRHDASVPYSPTNARPEGSRAVAQVLQRHGVHLREAQNLNEVQDALSQRPATLVITDPDDLPSRDLDDVLNAANGCRVVVLQPSDAVRERLFTNPSDSRQGSVSPADASGTHIAINRGSVLANVGITDDDNAQLALRALGHDRHLVWISNWRDHSRQASARGLAWPAWKTPLIWALFLSVVFLILARGRRFGRLAVEPLPVLVKSVESTRSLATLYRRSGASDRAAAALQAGTARRLAQHLALPRGARKPADIVSALGEERRELAACLLSPAPTSDQELLELARQLETLEKEITRD